MAKRKLNKNPQEMATIVQGFYNSGLNVTNYCNKHGYPAGSFYNWKAKYDDGELPAVRKNSVVAKPKVNGASGFLQVKSEGIVIEKNGIKIILPEGVDVSTIKDVIDAVEG